MEKLEKLFNTWKNQKLDLDLLEDLYSFLNSGVKSRFTIVESCYSMKLDLSLKLEAFSPGNKIVFYSVLIYHAENYQTVLFYRNLLGALEIYNTIKENLIKIVEDHESDYFIL